MNLPNKPLVEAILEIRWALKGPTGVSPVPGFDPALMPPIGVDPGFKILVGRLYDAVKGDYPVLLNLPASGMPEEITPYVVRHQLRAKPDAWPLMQLGPGIFTLNETEGYSWETFAPRAKQAVSALTLAYPTEISPWVPNLLVLKYVNAVPFNFATDALIPFLRDKLHVTIALAPKLAETVTDVERPSGLTFQIMLPTKSSDGVRLTLQTGGTAKGPAVIWQLEEIAQGATTPRTADQVGEWLERAHEMMETWFRVLADGPLMEGFGSGE